MTSCRRRRHFYTTSFWAVSTWLGTIGLFGALLLLVLRYLPVASIVELRLARPPAGGDCAAWLKTSKLYGVSAEFASPEALARRRAAALRRTRHSARWMRSRRCRSRAWTRRLALRGPSLGWIASPRVAAGWMRLLRHDRRRHGRQLSVQHRRPAAVELAVLHHSQLRGRHGLRRVVVALAMLFLDRLPRLNHPVFNIDGIEGVTQDRMFLVGGSALGRLRSRQRAEHAWPPCRSGRCASSGCRDEVALGSRRCCCCLLLATCAQEDMFVQQRAVPWGTFAFLPHGMTMQHPVPGTVARNAPDTPVPQPAAITRRDAGARPAGVSTSTARPATAASGDGYGMIVERGFPKPPPLFCRRADQGQGAAFLRRHHATATA